MQRPPASGFTLAELMVVLAIVGLLTSLALPALRQTGLQRQLRVAVDELSADLDRARLLAIATGIPVDIMPGDGTRSWAGGWSARQRGRLLTAIGHLPLDAHLRAARRQQSLLRFAPDGTVDHGRSITLCLRKRPLTALSVVISAAGRVRVSPAETDKARDCAR